MKKLFSIFLIIAMLAANTAVFAEVSKDETVYAKLKHDGAVEEVRIVNHIYGSSDASHFIDYGSYISIKNMTDNTTPEVEGEEIKWPMEVLKAGDVYYEGTIRKELPVELHIQYFLDGKPIEPKDLGGKSGHFKLDITIRFSKAIDWDKASLLAQLQLTPDLDVFSNIQTEGSRVVVGKKANIAFVAFPSSEQSFSFEADGKNIYLDPINITLISSSFSLPEDAKEGIDQLGDGLSEMEGGTHKLAKAAEALATGTSKLKTGLMQLNSGVGQLYQGTKELSSESKAILAGMEQFYGGLKELSKQSGQIITGFNQLTSGMEELTAKGEELYGGLGQLHGGLQSASTGTKELSGGLDQLAGGHSQLMQLASAYANSSDPMLRKLAEGVIQEGDALNKLNAGLKESAKGLETMEISAGLLHKGFGAYQGGVAQIAVGMKELQKGLGALPAAMEQLSTSFGTMKSGIGKYIAGVVEINKAVGMLQANTKQLPDNASKLAEGQTQLKDGIVSLNEGIKEMSEGVNGEMIDSFLGSSNSYNSFADNEKNKNSTVQFIMRTPSIDRPEVKAEALKTEVEKKGFLERLFDLFR